MAMILGEARGVITLDISDLQAKVGMATASLSSLDSVGMKGMQGFESQLNSAGVSVERFGMGMIGLGAALGAPMVIGIKNAANLEQAFRDVEASIPKADRTRMPELQKMIIDIGAAGQYSAAEIAMVTEELAKSGFEIDAILSGDPAKGFGNMAQAVSDLSSATGSGLAPAVHGISTAMNIWNPAIVDSSIALTDASRAADIFTVAANASSADVTDIIAGMRNFGPVAASLGVGFEEAAASIAYFTNFGIKATVAGTALSTGLSRLANPTSEASALLQELGVAAFDASGTFVGMPNLMDQLAGAMGNMSQEQRLAAMSIIFGLEAMDAMQLTALTGGDALREITAEMGNVGIASEQAALRTRTLQGAWERLTEGVSTFLAVLAGGLIGPLTMAANAIDSLVAAVMMIPEPILQAIGVTTALASAVLIGGGSFLVAYPKIMAFVRTLGLLASTGGKLGAVSGAMLRMIGIAGSLASVLRVLAIPFGLIFGAGILAYQSNFLGFADTVNTGMNRIKGAWSGFKDFFQPPQESVDRWNEIDMSMRSIAGSGADGLDWFAVGSDGKDIGQVISSIKDLEKGTITAKVRMDDGEVRTFVQDIESGEWKMQVSADIEKAMGSFDILRMGIGNIQESLNKRGITFLDPLFTGAQKGLNGIEKLGGGFGKLKKWWGDFQDDFAGTRGLPGMDFMDRIASAWRTSSMFGNNPIIAWAGALRENVSGAWESMSGFAGRIPLIGGTVSRVMGTMGTAVGKFADGFSRVWKNTGDLNLFQRGISGLAEGLRSAGFEGAAMRVAKVGNAISTGLVSALDKGRTFVDTFRQSWDLMGKSAGPMASQMGVTEKVLRSIGDAFDSIGLESVGALFHRLADAIEPAKAAVSGFFDTVRSVGSGLWDGITSGLGTAFGKVKDFFTELKNAWTKGSADTDKSGNISETGQRGRGDFNLLEKASFTVGAALQAVGAEGAGNFLMGLAEGLNDMRGFNKLLEQNTDVGDKLLQWSFAAQQAFPALQVPIMIATAALWLLREAGELAGRGLKFLGGIALDLGGKLWGKVKGGAEKLWDWLTGTPETVRPAVHAARDFGAAFEQAWDMAGKSAGPFGQQLKTTERFAFALGEAFKAVGLEGFGQSIQDTSDRLHAAWRDGGPMGLVREGVQMAAGAILDFTKGAGSALKNWALDIAPPSLTGWIGSFMDDPWAALKAAWGGLKEFRASIRDWYIDIAEPNIAGGLVAIDDWITEKLGLDQPIRKTIHDWWLEMGAPTLSQGVWELGSLVLDLIGTAVVSIGSKVWSLMMGEPTIVLGFDLDAAFESVVGNTVMWAAEALTTVTLKIINDPMGALKVALLAAAGIMLAGLFITGGATALITLGALLGLAALAVAVVNAIRDYFAKNPAKLEELKLKIDRIWAALEGIPIIGFLFSALHDLFSMAWDVVGGLLALRRAVIGLGGPFATIVQVAELATLALATFFGLARLGGFGQMSKAGLELSKTLAKLAKQKDALEDALKIATPAEAKRIQSTLTKVTKKVGDLTVKLDEVGKVRYHQAVTAGLKRVAAFPFRLIFRPLDTLKGMLGIVGKDAKTGVGSLAFWTRKATKDGSKLVIHWGNFAGAFKNIGRLIGFTAATMTDTFRFLLPNTVGNRIVGSVKNLRVRIIGDLQRLGREARLVMRTTGFLFTQMFRQLQPGNLFPDTARQVRNIRTFFQSYATEIRKGIPVVRKAFGDSVIDIGRGMANVGRAMLGFTAPKGGGATKGMGLFIESWQGFRTTLFSILDDMGAGVLKRLQFFRGINMRQGGIIQARKDLAGLQKIVTTLPSLILKAGSRIRAGFARAFAGMFDSTLHFADPKTMAIGGWLDDIVRKVPGAGKAFDGLFSLMDKGAARISARFMGSMDDLFSPGKMLGSLGKFAQVGDNFLPTFGPFMDELRPMGPMLDDLAPAANRFRQAFTSIGDDVLRVAKGAGGGIRSFFGSFGDEFAEGVRKLGGLKPLANWIRNLGPAGRIAAAGIGLITGTALFKGGFLDGIISGVKGFGSAIGSAFSAISTAWDTGGLAGVLDLVISQAGAFFTSLPGRIADFVRNANWTAISMALLTGLSLVMMGPWGLALGLLAPVLAPILGDAIGGVVKIIDAFATGGLDAGFDTMQEVVTNGALRIGKGIGNIGAGMVSLAGPISRIPLVGKPAAAALTWMGEGLMGLGTKIAEAAPAIGKFVRVVSEDLVDGLKAGWKGLSKRMGPAFSDLLDSIGDLGKPLRKIGSGLKDLFTGNIISGAKKLGSGILDLGKGILKADGAFAKFIGAGLKGIGEMGRSLFSGLGDRFPALARTFGSFGDTIGGAFETVGHLASGLGNLLTGEFGAAWESVKAAASSAMDAVKGIFTAFPNFIRDVFTAIDWAGLWDGLKGAAGWIRGALGDAAGAIRDWWNNTVTAIDWAGVLQRAMDVLSAAGSWLLGVLGSAADILQGWWDAVAGVNWSGVLQTALDVLRDIGSWILEKIGQAASIATAVGRWVYDKLAAVQWGTWAKLALSALTSIGSWILEKIKQAPDFAADIGGWVAGKISEINWSEKIGNALGAFADFGGWLLEKVQPGINALVSWLIDKVNQIISLVNQALSAMNALTPGDLDIPLIDPIDNPFVKAHGGAKTMNDELVRMSKNWQDQLAHLAKQSSAQDEYNRVVQTSMEHPQTPTNDIAWAAEIARRTKAYTDLQAQIVAVSKAERDRAIVLGMEETMKTMPKPGVPTPVAVPEASPVNVAPIENQAKAVRDLAKAWGEQVVQIGRTPTVMSESTNAWTKQIAQYEKAHNLWSQLYGQAVSNPYNPTEGGVGQVTQEIAKAVPLVRGAAPQFAALFSAMTASTAAASQQAAVWQTMGPALQPVNTGFGDFTRMTTSLVPAMNALTPAQRQLLTNNQGLSASMQATPFIPYAGGWSSVGSAVVPARTAVAAAAGTFTSTGAAVNTAATGMSTNVAGSFAGMHAATVTRFTGMQSTATGESGTMNRNVTGAGSTMAGALIGTVSRMGGSVTSSFAALQRGGSGEASSLQRNATSSASSMDRGVSGSGKSMSSNVLASMRTMRGGSENDMGRMAATAGSKGSEMATRLRSGASQAAGGVQSEIGRVPGIISSIGGSAAGVAYSVGANISASMASGMRSALGAIQAAAAAMVAAADTALRAKAMIASPSKLFTYLGEMTGLGYAGGIRRTFPEVQKTTRMLVEAPQIERQRRRNLQVGSSRPIDRSGGNVYNDNRTYLALRSEEWVKVAAQAESGAQHAHEWEQPTALSQYLRR